ncbi:hypothetical protein BaRGS_00039063 [Batillaria attramentaria]|uniref:Uncharacterized protein n=1 Tax=Batillaria attramentaria TaxID=370345 RepID=A0ABD0J445_9CAEN
MQMRSLIGPSARPGSAQLSAARRRSVCSAERDRLSLAGEQTALSGRGAPKQDWSSGWSLRAASQCTVRRGPRGQHLSSQLTAPALA